MRLLWGENMPDAENAASTDGEAIDFNGERENNGLGHFWTLIWGVVLAFSVCLWVCIGGTLTYSTFPLARWAVEPKPGGDHQRGAGGVPVVPVRVPVLVQLEAG